MKCNALCVVESCKQCAVCGVPACETQRVFVLYHGERQERHNAHLHTHPCMPLSRLSPVPCPEVDSGSKGNIDAHFSKCLYYLHSMNITTRKKSKGCRLGVRGRRWRPGSQDSVLLLLSSCSATSITEKHLNPELFLERNFFFASRIETNLETKFWGDHWSRQRVHGHTRTKGQDQEAGYMGTVPLRMISTLCRIDYTSAVSSNHQSFHTYPILPSHSCLPLSAVLGVLGGRPASGSLSSVHVTFLGGTISIFKFRISMFRETWIEKFPGLDNVFG